MKKIILSFIYIFAFTAYVIFRTHTSASPVVTQKASTAQTTSLAKIHNTPTQKQTPSTTRALTVKTVTHSTQPAVQKSMPMTKPKSTVTHMHMHQGPYVDGVYMGPAADAYYEMIQVKILIKNGSLADVYFVPTQMSGTSRQINNYVMPILRSEALTIQNANVNMISGATETSNAFRSSLSGALRKAT